MTNKASIFRFADVEVREREFSLIKSGESLPVEPKVFRVLLILLRNPKKLITKEELLNAVWGDAAVTENSLTRSIALLRRLLGDDTHNPRYIETVATVGYRFICPVEVAEDPTENLESPAEQAPRSQAINAAGADRPRNIHRRLGIVIGTILCLVVTAFAVWRGQSRIPAVANIVRLTNDRTAKIPINGVVTDGLHLY